MLFRPFKGLDVFLMARTSCQLSLSLFKRSACENKYVIQMRSEQVIPYKLKKSFHILFLFIYKILNLHRMHANFLILWHSLSSTIYITYFKTMEPQKSYIHSP